MGGVVEVGREHWSSNLLITYPNDGTKATEMFFQANGLMAFVWGRAVFFTIGWIGGSAPYRNLTLTDIPGPADTNAAGIATMEGDTLPYRMTFGVGDGGFSSGAGVETEWVSGAFVWTFEIFFSYRMANPLEPDDPFNPPDGTGGSTDPNDPNGGGGGPPGTVDPPGQPGPGGGSTFPPPIIPPPGSGPGWQPPPLPPPLGPDGRPYSSTARNPRSRFRPG